MPVDILVSGCLDTYESFWRQPDQTRTRRPASLFMVTVDGTLGLAIAIGAVPNLSRFVSRSQHATKTDKEAYGPFESGGVSTLVDAYSRVSIHYRS